MRKEQPQSNLGQLGMRRWICLRAYCSQIKSRVSKLKTAACGPYVAKVRVALKSQRLVVGIDAIPAEKPTC